MPLTSPETLRSLLTLEAACNNAPYGVLVADADLTVRYVNLACCRFLGTTPDTLVGHLLYDALPHLKDSTSEVVTTPILTGETTSIFEFAAPMPGREAEGTLYWDATYSPVFADERIVGVMAQFMDVTPRVRARQDAERRAAELDVLFNTITDGLVHIGAQGEFLRMNRAAQHILRGPLPTDLPLSEAHRFYTIRDPQTGQPMLSDDIAPVRALRGETVLAQEQLLRDGTGTDIILSVNAAPLREPETGAIRGAVGLFRDITNVKRLEAETAAAHARARRIAQTLQSSLMPSVPLHFDHHTMGVAFEAAWVEEADVGGDLLDFFSTANNTRAHVLIADVSGKGLMAARRTALIKYTVRALALSGMDIRSLVMALNDALLADTEFEGFVTVFYGVFNIAGHTLQYANAGHEPGLRWDGRAKKVQELSTTGLPLGIMPSAEQPGWKVVRTHLRPEDALLLYTDGFTEAPMRGTRRLLGEKRAQELFREALLKPDGPSGVSHILAAIHAHAGPRLRDDLALMLLRGNDIVVG